MSEERPIGKAGLTEKQRKFVDEFLSCDSATEAAKRAGYANPMVEGSKLLKKAKIRMAVAERSAELRINPEDNRVLKNKVIKELAYIAFSDLADFGHWNKSGFHVFESLEIDPEKRRALAEFQIADAGRGIRVKIRLYDKLKALETLCRYLGMFDQIDDADKKREPFVIKFDNGKEIHLGVGKAPNDVYEIEEELPTPELELN
jgi:phage terminase small subunit